MDKITFKVESGVQLLSRLFAKNSKVENFYPNLLKSALNVGDVIEITSKRSSSFLLVDMVCEALIPVTFGGTEAGVLILNTDGHITMRALIISLQKKLKTRVKFTTDDEYTQIFQDILNNLYILDIFDATQLYTTLQNLENLLLKHTNISLCIIDTLTAFYWSEQSFKITKMDTYLKSILRMVQTATKGVEIVIIYTRPEYFNSNKDSIQNLESCCENPTAERVNLRIQLVFNDDETCTAKVKHFNNDTVKHFKTENNQISWL